MGSGMEGDELRVILIKFSGEFVQADAKTTIPRQFVTFLLHIECHEVFSEQFHQLGRCGVVQPYVHYCDD